MTSVAVQHPEQVPDWMGVEPGHDGTVYSWPMLPRKPLLIGFFVLLAALLTLPGPFLVAADVLDRLDLFESVFRGAAGIWPLGAVLCVFTVATAKFFVVALLGRCRLVLSPRALDYEVLLFGRALRSERRHVPREQLVRIRITDPAHQGPEVERQGGRPFRIKVPVGAGALSRQELERLRDRWLRDLGWASG